MCHDPVLDGDEAHGRIRVIQGYLRPDSGGIIFPFRNHSSIKVASWPKQYLAGFLPYD